MGYWIVGHGDSLSNFNLVLYPQDTRNCLTCHVQTHPLLTEAANFKTVPTMEACGACHDNVNFATGLNHPGGIQTNDALCADCHIPQGEMDFDASTRGLKGYVAFLRTLRQSLPASAQRQGVRCP